MLVIAAVLSLVLFFPLLRTGIISGGGLLPLSDSIGDLWGRTGHGVRDASGTIGIADTFVFVLAVLGTLTFWQPSLAVTALWLAAMPLAALGAWFLVARMTGLAWVRVFAGFAWMLAPPFLVALTEGRIGAVIAHLALPWLMFAAFGAVRGWGAAAAAALCALVVAASAPMLLAPLAVLWVVSVAISGPGRLRHLLMPVPTAALFLPLAVTQWNRGRPLAVFADPGVPLGSSPVRGAEVALGLP